MKVLFVVPYPMGKAASQRFRVEQFLPLLPDQGIKYDLKPFWTTTSWAILYKDGYTLQKVYGVISGFFKRLILLTRVSRYDFVFVHREATPVGPPWFEWIAVKVFHSKLVFDFDDAIWLENTSEENRGATKYKWHNKTADICKWSYKISAGNSFLQNYALQFNPEVKRLPSTLDVVHKYNKTKNQLTDSVVIGWIGSHSTLSYLKLIEPVLQRLEERYIFEFIVIADRAPTLNLRSLRFIPWNADTEVEELLQFNIGIMPLPETEWAKGKCAFKALQYMALGIPAVVSAVGANTEAVLHGKTGYTCNSEQEWFESLERLLSSADLRVQLGEAGKGWVAGRYSLQACRQAFLNLFT